MIVHVHVNSCQLPPLVLIKMPIPKINDFQEVSTESKQMLTGARLHDYMTGVQLSKVLRE